ncbi:hypothetical protein BD626DRAFT_424170 [Schizophyllum amplum]|uniref:RRM domain-containing protein n=1 Tax=Schizophyllum amplum TaxID=97359 RepID=A0A550CSM7_9AGAR|nr:hypothetical protein BD626DRAFT_424170 [Auriculariopsis ampla]
MAKDAKSAAKKQEKKAAEPKPSPSSKSLKRKQNEATDVPEAAAKPKKLKTTKTTKVEEKPVKEERGKKTEKVKLAPAAEPSEKKAKIAAHEPQTISRPTSKSLPKPSKAMPKSKAVAPPAEDLEEEEEDAGVGSDEEVHLHGLSSDEDDSSDEEVVDEGPIDVGKLPTVAKDDETVARKLEKAKRQQTGERGVIYIGRLPHGFYEDQLKAYFSQFGEVTRLRVSRNKKTGKSKHYAFLEFDSSSVGQIVAETMDNYLIMGHILRCKVIPKDEVHPELWIGANRKYRTIPTARISRLQHDKSRTDEEQKRVEKRLLKRQREQQRKLAAAGIDYDMEGATYKPSVTVA